MSLNLYESWGRFPKAVHEILPAGPRPQAAAWRTARGKVLPFGKGRSYGDVCLNDDGTLLDTAALDHFAGFDAGSGVLECEAGVTLEEILRVFTPRGWFPPVLPGTKFVTVGGAIANDIHGKNHHRSGTFGCHVLSIDLLRSSGELLRCSAEENAGLFNATIGGLGLTGLIVSAKIRLNPVPGPWMDAEHVPFETPADFFRLSRESDRGHEYTVAWVDCLSGRGRAGRGIFIRGNHASGLKAAAVRPQAKRQVSIPVDAPAFLLNAWTLKAFNRFYYFRQSRRRGVHSLHYESFFFPLDAVLHWNRLYGRGGFLQYQFVLPEKTEERMPEFFERIAHSGLASCLAVLKRFGPRPSPGMLSFPRAGTTLALDFPIRGKPVFKLLDELDQLVARYGGSVYPAKDARMSAAAFAAFFPQSADFSRFIDPCFSSGFWRRVSGERKQA